MSRFISWLAIGVSAAFLVVASASFSLDAIAWLAFAIAIGTLVVSAGVAYYNRAYVPSLSTALLIVVISAWTIVASRVFSPATVQHLALGSSLAISGFALVGLTANELSHAGEAESAKGHSSERKSRLAAAA
jgi:hypothetical protein